MKGKSIVGWIIIAILFIFGIIFLSIFDIFSENWLIGIGVIIGAIAVFAIMIYLKVKSKLLRIRKIKL